MKTLVVMSKKKGIAQLSADALKKGGIIIYPTESSYGIGADATNAKAIRKIFSIKNRVKGKPVSIIVSSFGMAKKYAVINAATRKLAKKLMPGPLTIVTEKKNLPDFLSKKTIAWRIPSHPFALAVARKLGKPITATSANMAGLPAMYKINNAIKAFSGKVNMIIDSGNLPERKPSTVYDVANRKVIRKGPVSEKDIEKCLKA